MPQTQFLDVAGKKTQLIVQGDGPPLVYLHSAAGETEWTSFHERLSRRFRLYVPAHPGFALSAGLDQIRDMDDLAWHYVDLFETLGLSGVPVVGMSLGGWLACEILLRRPQLASKLVLCAAAGLRVEGAPIAELFVDSFDRVRPLLFLNPRIPQADELMPSSHEDSRVLLWLRAREATARVAWNPYLHNPRLPRHLRRIPCPTLVLWGEQDAVIPVAHGREYARLLPNARLQTIDACGHMLQFEQTETFVSAIEQFVSS